MFGEHHDFTHGLAILSLFVVLHDDLLRTDEMLVVG